MNTEIVEVTRKIDVIEEDLENLKKDIYFSRVEDMTDSSVFITPPFRKGFLLPPRIGRQITARIVADKVPYLFQSNLLRYLPGPFPLWEITFPAVFNKIQMREDVRLEINLKVNLEVSAGEDEIKIFKTLTRDLSAGGAQVLLPSPLSVGTTVRINVTLCSEFEFVSKGIIIHVIPPLPPVDKYFAGVKFLEVTEATKKRIIRYIFAKQAEIRMKEKEWFS